MLEARNIKSCGLSAFGIKKLASRCWREQFSHPLVDVDEIVAVGAAVLHIFAGVDAERDATAQEEPARCGDAGNEWHRRLFYSLIMQVCQTRRRGCYPNMAIAPQINQVSRPGVWSILVITVWRQWGHDACPGRSPRRGETTTWVTAEEKRTALRVCKHCRNRGKV